MTNYPDMVYHMGGVPVSGPITKGDVWFVDGDVSATGNGMSFDNAFLTITEAIAAASDDDVIFVSPGTYTETAAQTVTQANLKIIGSAGGSGGKALSETFWQQYAQSTDTLIIDASNVEIAHMKFVPDLANSAIKVANGAGTGGVWIHDCYFYDVGQNNVDPHVRLGSASYNAVGSVVENCYFFKGKTGLYIDNASRFMVRNNYFTPLHTCSGIKYDAGTGEIVSNRFTAQGTANEQRGIYFTAAPDTGTVMADDNRFVNFASDAYCVDDATSTAIGGLNYNNHSAIATS